MNSSNRELFDKAIAYWPKEISVIDKTLFDNGGANIPLLDEIHDSIERKIIQDKESHDLIGMDWAIYTVLHMSARSADILKISEINFTLVDEIYIENAK